MPSDDSASRTPLSRSDARKLADVRRQLDAVLALLDELGLDIVASHVSLARSLLAD